MRFVRRALAAAVVAYLAVATRGTRADEYSFVEIARTSGFGESGFAEILSPASINNLGEVAFLAKDGVSEIGVFRGDAATITTIADTSGDVYNTFQGTPAINDAGQVAFNAALQHPAGGIAGFGYFRGAGGAIDTIADTLPGHFIRIGRDPAINASGAVAFEGHDGVADGMFVGAGGSVTAIYRPGNFGFTYGGEPDISDDGNLAFVVNPGSGTQGVARGSGGLPVIVGSGYSLISRIAINEGLAVAFRAGAFVDPTDAVYTGVAAGSAMPVAANTGPFSEFDFEAALSAAGVAFRANLDEGPKGIFTGADPVADKVIQIGDMLFGGAVGAFPHEFSRFAINDRGQIAFVVFSGDQQRVVRADPLVAISADFDDDDDVDGADFLLWQNGLGLTSGADRNDGDANGDGDVDGDDLGIWQSQFGMSGGGAALPAPEPGAMALALVAAICGGACRRRTRLFSPSPAGIFL